ncbi:esterase/lipase family protein [Boudabousia marimammalium]|uniref:Alpha/beta hydrolase n=1 Tax=Boudabousia marimammalium TaxID=156892 RepID=A0A1Q5PMS9_9ACTO|nr:hypothetical protein [Boudabousia marimammalium]OKL48750.1 hypothetical protein BM477_06045 [Boudabousia marimammalium]
MAAPVFQQLPEGSALPAVAQILRALAREGCQDLADTVTTWKDPRPPQRWRQGNLIPVVAIPGINESWISLRPLLEGLNQTGHPIITVPQLGRSIAEPQRLAQIVQGQVNFHALDRYAIVAHSKGGLVARALLRTSAGKAQVAKVVTVGTPYAGSPWGYIFPAGSQIGRLRPTATFFTSTDGPDFPYHRFLAISSSFDHKLLGDSFLDPKAQHLTVPALGHTLPLHDPQVLKIARNALGQLLAEKAPRSEN